MGLLAGHTISMGQYEECIEINRQFTAEEAIRGQYCLTKIPIKNYYKKIEKDDAQSRAISYKYKDPENFELGICVPASCSPAKANVILKRVIKKFYNQDVQGDLVSEKYCDIDEPITLRGIDIFAM